MGMGYPVLNFYAPATSYLAGSIQLLDATTAHPVLVALMLYAVASGMGMYFLAHDHPLDGIRAPMTDGAGRLLPDQIAPLTEAHVEAGGD